MSVDVYVLTPHRVSELTPRLLGLGAAPFVWSDPDDPASFDRPGATLAFTASDFEQEVADDEEDGLYRRMAHLAPPGMRAVLSLWTRGRPGFESILGEALSGTSTSDALLYSELWDEAVDDPEIRATLLAPLPDEARRVSALVRVRASIWADRHRPTSPEGAAMVQAALRGSEDALAVLRAWDDHDREDRLELVDTKERLALRRVVLDAAAGVTRAPDGILSVFRRRHGAERDDRAALDVLARVVSDEAMRAFLADAEARAAAWADEARRLEEAKAKGDFF